MDTNTTSFMIVCGLVLYMFGLIIYQGQLHENRLDSFIEYSAQRYVMK